MAAGRTSEATPGGEDLVLPFGPGRLGLTLPPHLAVAINGAPQIKEAVPDLAAAVRSALQEPLEAVPLGQRDLSNKRVVVVVDDCQRPTPIAEILPLVLAELDGAGCDRDRVQIIMGLGLHAAPSAEQARSKLGADTIDSINWRPSCNRDSGALVKLGTTSQGTPVLLDAALTEADLIVCVGSIFPHTLAGTSGGMKALLPGCAGAEAIRANHRLVSSLASIRDCGFDPDQSQMRQDIEEACGFLSAEVFILNTVPGLLGSCLGVVAGHPIRAHRKGASLARRAYGVPVPEPVDVAILSAHPSDGVFRQSVRAIGNHVLAVRPGGTVVAAMHCAGGIGDYHIPPSAPSLPVLRLMVKTVGLRVLTALSDLVNRKPSSMDDFLVPVAIEIAASRDLFVYAPGLCAEVKKKLPAMRFFDSLNEAVAEAAKKHTGPSRVGFFPSAGLTYAAVNPE